MSKPHTEELRWISIHSQTTCQYQMRREIWFQEFWQETPLQDQHWIRSACIHSWRIVKSLNCFHSLCWPAHLPDSTSGNLCQQLLLALVSDTNPPVHCQEGWSSRLQLTHCAQEEKDWIVAWGLEPQVKVKHQFLLTEVEPTRVNQMPSVQLEPLRWVLVIANRERCLWFRTKE